MQNMQLEIDLLKETISVLKKDPGIDQTALKDRYSLSVLLEKLSFPKSSYYYQEASLKQEDKYNDIRKKITKLFYENKGCYGYRRIYGLLKRKGILIYEKIVLRLMHEEDFVVKIKDAENTKQEMAYGHHRICHSCGESLPVFDFGLL